MSLLPNRLSSLSSHPQTNRVPFRRQTPTWVYGFFCLLWVIGLVATTGQAAASPPPQVFAAGCSELLINGGFEVKDLVWQTFGAESPPAYTTSPVFAGEQAMRLGIVEGPNLAIINGVRQTVTLPNSAASLVVGFHFRPIHESLPGDDLQYLEIYDANSGVRLYQLHTALNNSATWIFLQYDLTSLKGKTIRIDAGVRNDGGGGRTAMIIDDVSLLSCDAGAVPTASPTGLSTLATPTPTNLSQTLTPTVSATATPTPIPSASATATPIVVTPPTATPVPAGCVNILENGSFEQPLGSSTGWLPGDGDPVGPVLSSEQVDGLRSLQMGNPPGAGTRDVASYSSIRQLVEIPLTASTAKLSWRHQSRSQEVASDNPLPPRDRQELILLHPNLDTKDVRIRWRENVTSWQTKEDDLTKYIGDQFYIYFNVYNDANNTRTWMFLDDVRLIVCYPVAPSTATPTPSASETATPTPTETPTQVVAAAALPNAPTLDSLNTLSSGLPTPETSQMVRSLRESDPLAPASASRFQAFANWFGRNFYAILFGVAVFFVLAVIYSFFWKRRP